MVKRINPEVGQNRVASWISQIINTLLDVLPNEVAFLEKRDITWRFTSRDLKYIKPLARYFSRNGRHVYRDFLKANPAVKLELDKHDDCRSKLKGCAAEAHDSLCQDQNFIKSVNDCLMLYKREHSRAPDPFGTHGLEGFPALVAENIINRIGELDSCHTDYLFWNQYRSKLMGIASGTLFVALDRAIDEFKQYDESLILFLEDLSFDFCTQYDVPASGLL